MVPIVKIMGDIVSKVSANMLTYLQSIDANYSGVRYDYGHPSDIVGRIAQYSNTPEFRFKKYPLIGLFLDFPEKRGEDYTTMIKTSARLDMFICCGTNKTHTPQQRTDATFIPILIPIYEEFLKQLRLNKNIVTPNGGIFRHNYTARYQWGKGGIEYYENGKKNIF
jgi:hypothetical protein